MLNSYMKNIRWLIFIFSMQSLQPLRVASSLIPIILELSLSQLLEIGLTWYVAASCYFSPLIVVRFRESKRVFC